MRCYMENLLTVSCVFYLHSALLLGSSITNEKCQKRTFLSNEAREAIYHLLLPYIRNGRLRRGAIKEIASMFSVSDSVIKRIWKKIKVGDEVCHKRTINSGRKKVELDLDKFSQIPFARRTTLRDLSFALDINKTSLFRLKKDGAIKRHTNAIKPFLKEEEEGYGTNKTSLIVCIGHK